MEQGWGSPVTYSECFQWFIAPTDLSGANPDPGKAPHVVNNSWSCPAIEGCTDPNIMLTVVENVRAAGIVVISSAGNAGSNCSTVNKPAAIYDAAFTVGATNSSDAIANFSSRGPVTVDGSGRLKPDISAPGVSVRSSIRNDSYGFYNGTSQAAPHVAGLTALLISANPTLDGQVDWIEDAIINSALPLTTTQECGGIPGNQIPNNTFGAGRIDALAAYQAIAPEHLLPVTINWSNGTQSSRLLAFMPAGRFTDSDGGEGTWIDIPSVAGLLFSYPPDQACYALGLGWVTGPDAAHGFLYCRDGSELRGTWQTETPPLRLPAG
jgi:subtilisin family serine protease